MVGFVYSVVGLSSNVLFLILIKVGYQSNKNENTEVVEEFGYDFVQNSVKKVLLP